MISRRYFTKWLFGLPLLSFFPFRVSELSAQSSQPVMVASGKTIGEFFAGEELTYEISFLFLKKVAVAKMTFKPSDQKGRYIATLQGETLGVVGWLTKYRTDMYLSGILTTSRPRPGSLPGGLQYTGPFVLLA